MKNTLTKEEKSLIKAFVNYEISKGFSFPEECIISLNLLGNSYADHRETVENYMNTLK